MTSPRTGPDSAAEPGPVRFTNVGSWPGTDIDDATRIAFDLCPELPYLPELPARGPHAQLVGRGTGLLSGLAVDLQPAGWRLTDAPGRDGRLARALWRSDLDVLEEVAQGYAGPVKLAVCGPWTLAAAMERPRGDRILADHGARRDVAQSLTEGLGELVAELTRRLPAVDLVVQLDEPLLPAVLAGEVATASGFSRHRAVEVPEVSDAYSALVQHVTAVVTAPPAVIVHSCADGVPVDLLRGAGLAGVSLDLDRMGTPTWDAVGAALSEGMWFGAGILPTASPAASWPAADRIAARLLSRLDELGLGATEGTRTVLTPACGLAALTRDQAVSALRTLRTAAEIVTDRLLG